MKFWNFLFKKPTSAKPAVQPGLMEEIRRLDALDAIDAQSRKVEYWRTLHPLLQAYLLYRVNWAHQDEVPISAADARSIFSRWGYPAGSYSADITPVQKEWMDRCDSQKEMLWQQSKEAEKRFLQIEAETGREKEAAWETYRAHFETLSPDLQSRVGWELAKRGASRGTSGFHGGNYGSPFPFSVLGWASYRDPEWGDTEGVAFGIRKACFGDRDPVLFYLDDDGWPKEFREKKALAIIEEYSSGISNIRVERRRCKDWHGEEKEQRVLLFSLDPAAVKKNVVLSGKPVPAKDVGEYVFVLPRCGEFYCLLGEELDGEMIPLHRDDFCMK